MIFFTRAKRYFSVHAPLLAVAKTAGVIFVLFFVFAFGYVSFEKITWGEAFWQAWQTFTTVGYGNAPAATLFGRLFTMVVGTIGIAVMAIFIAVVSDLRAYFRQQIRLGFSKMTLNDHYVVINFTNKCEATKVINQIRQKETYKPICFVDSELEELPESIRVLPNVRFIRGKLTEKDTYLRASVGSASAVMVFPNSITAEDVDLNTKSIVDLVFKFAHNTTNVLYVLSDAKNKWLFPERATPILKNFWIYALVQECQGAHCSSVISQLVDNSDNESINSVTVEKQQTWKEFTDYVYEKDIPINPIALKRGNKPPELLPKKDSVIDRDDVVFFACANDFNVDSIFS